MNADNRLDITPLCNAVHRLQEGLARYQQNVDDLQIRDGLIQRFEFTYEISHKMLKRYLEFSSPDPTIFDGMNFQDLIRSGNEKGLLLGSWGEWRTYRDMRSRTGHSYDEHIALQVVEGIPAFLQEALFLKNSLENRLND